jgi:spore germination cell wall hydrolase CwlJ-like protein
MKRFGTGLLAAILLAVSIPVVSYAATTYDRIQQAEREKADNQREQENAENELGELEGQHQSLKGTLDQYNKEMEVISARLDDLATQIAKKEQDILDTQEALRQARELEAWQYECMSKRARDNYLQDDMNYLELIFHEANWALLLNWSDYEAKISEADRKLREDYKATRISIEEYEAQLEEEMKELEELQAEAEADKATQTTLINDMNSKVNQKKGEIQATEAEIQAYEEKEKELNKNLEALYKKLAEEIAKSQAAAKGVWRDISEISFDEGDRFLLATIIYCEAGGEPYAGQVAVGAVVINRVRSSEFPSTVSGVIYQNRQFSPVASGRYALALAEDRATASCYRAADEAMSGMTNVGNCVFFRTPIEGLTGISIGGHIFY